MKVSILFLLLSLGGAISHADTDTGARDVRAEWYTQATGVYRERYAWQMDRGFLNALVYQLNLYVYDMNTYGCKLGADVDPMGASCLAPMQKCPNTVTPKETGLDLPTFLAAFAQYGYCRDKEEVTGTNFPASVKNSPLFRTNFENQLAEYAPFQESYASVPVALRRTIHALTKNIWSHMTCNDFNTKKNVVTTRVVSAPIMNYDCAAYQEGKNTTTDFPFVPRDRGMNGRCVQRTHIYFTGPNCTGTPLFLASTNKNVKNLAFFRVRSPDSGLLEDKNMIVQPPALPITPPPGPVEIFNNTFVAFDGPPVRKYDLALLRFYRTHDYTTGDGATYGNINPSMVAHAYYTEILDKTIYYAFENEAFRRTVKFVPVSTAGSTADAPYIKAYLEKSDVQSYYSDLDTDFTKFVASAPVCVSGNGSIPDGLYGVLDAVEGSVSRYSGVVFNHYRDRSIKTDDVAINSALKDHTYDLGTRNVACGAASLAETLVPTNRPKITDLYPVTATSHRAVGTDHPCGRSLDSSSTPATYPYQQPPAVSGTVYYDGFKPRTIHEWWSESPISDKTGLLQAVTCRVDENLIGLGRNSRNFGLDTDPNRGTLERAQHYCLRYPFGREFRTDASTGQVLFSDTGSPLPEVSTLTRGTIAGAMVCEDDEYVMTNPNPLNFQARIESPVTPGYTMFNYAAKVPSVAGVSMLSVIASRGATGGKKVINASAVDAQNEFLQTKWPGGDSILPVAARGFKMGDPGAEDALPRNYGLCARFKTLPEHRDYLMGPLAIPVRNYLILLVGRNTNEMPLARPPKCP